jgi:release factor glutamine methyltransferase
LSDDAIDLITENSDFTGLHVERMKMDALKDGYSAPDDYYDIIVSNPPYIPQSDRSRMEANVLDFEPEMALFVENDDPFVFYNKIAKESVDLLVDEGWLYFEIHEDYAEEMITCLENHGFVNIELRKDLQGRARMIRGQRVPSHHE